MAFRVCSRVRRARKRRIQYENASARTDASDAVIAEHRWEETLRIVHSEAAQLPEIYRTAFVLCCLEGKGLTEAAQQLGWKLGTLSGRLSRAKAFILHRLQSRGLSIAAVTALGLAAPSALLQAQTAGLLTCRPCIPVKNLQLSQEAMTMIPYPGKLAAMCLLVCVLALGTGWLALSAAPVAVQEAAASERAPVDVARPVNVLDFYLVNGKALPRVLRPPLGPSKLRGGEISKPGRYEVRQGTLIELHFTHPIDATTDIPFPKSLTIETQNKGVVAQAQPGVRAVDPEDSVRFKRALVISLDTVQTGEEKVTITINQQPHEYTFLVQPDHLVNYVRVCAIAPQYARAVSTIFCTAQIPHAFVGSILYEIQVPASYKSEALKLIRADVAARKYRIED